MTKNLGLILAVLAVAIFTGTYGLQCWQETKVPKGQYGGLKGEAVTCSHPEDECIHMEWLAQTEPNWRYGHIKNCGRYKLTCEEDSFEIRDRFRCWSCSTDMCNASWRILPNITILLLPIAILKLLL